MVVGPAVTSDLGDLVKNFEKAERDIKKVSQVLMEETGEEIAERMRMYVPVRTGRLKSSIRVVTEPGRVVIGPVGVDYAYYVEYGVGTLGELAQVEKKSTKTLVKMQGRWMDIQPKANKGRRAKPYIRPAAAEVLEGIGANYAEAGRRLIAGQKNA